MTLPTEADQTSLQEPTSGPKLRVFLTQKTLQRVASSLSLPENAIDTQIPFAELGLDSVMMFELRINFSGHLSLKWDRLYYGNTQKSDISGTIRVSNLGDLCASTMAYVKGTGGLLS